MHQLCEGIYLERRKINHRRHQPTSPVVLTEDDAAVEAATPVESPIQPVRKQRPSFERRLSLEEMAHRVKPKRRYRRYS
jgi:hypothetical protein